MLLHDPQANMSSMNAEGKAFRMVCEPNLLMRRPPTLHHLALRNTRTKNLCSVSFGPPGPYRVSDEDLMGSGWQACREQEL